MVAGAATGGATGVATAGETAGTASVWAKAGVAHVIRKAAPPPIKFGFIDYPPIRVRLGTPQGNYLLAECGQ